MLVTEQTPDLHAALKLTRAFFRDRRTKAGVVARALARPYPTDNELTEHLVRERRRRTRMDGSVEGSLVSTAWTVWELLELGCPPDHSAVVRTLGYVLEQQDRPGHAFEGCDAERHERQLCRHFLTGFFSPGQRDRSVAPIRFPSGVAVTTEEEARFAASCFALRVVLKAGEERRVAVQRHIESLVTVTRLWKAGKENWSPDLMFFVLGALAEATVEYRTVVDETTAHLMELQSSSGEWWNADLFHALDVLLSIPSGAAREGVRNAVPLLCSFQRESGAFDDEESEARALVALRAFSLAHDIAAKQSTA